MSNFCGNMKLTRFVNAANQLDASNIKMYSCSKCNNHYDVYSRNNANAYIGKVPLILNCRHTMCEECIQISLTKGGIVCNECGQSSVIEPDSKQKLQNIFPINFYLLGVIHSSKPNMSESSKLKLQPGGVCYMKPSKSHYGSSISLQEPPDSLENLLQEQCCKENCKQLATLRCIDCVEVYCESCSQQLHRGARGLKKHRIISSNDSMPELNNKCSSHKDYALEFYCDTCQLMVCCYCLIQAHYGHPHIQLSDINILERGKFEDLIETAGEKLKQLIFAHKRVQDELTVTTENFQISEVDLAIGRYFTNLHAKLQCLEKKFKKEASESKNRNLHLLKEIDHDLSSNIRTLKGLIVSAKNVLNPNNDTKFNVKVILERLENALALPCYFVGEKQNINVEFICDDSFNNMEEWCALNINGNSNEYRLVDEDGLPDNYDINLPSELMSLNVSDLTKVMRKSTDSISPQLSLKSVPYSPPSSSGRNFNIFPKPNVEGWIKSVSDISPSNDFPKLQTENREKVLVSYIDTPGNFYVQLNCREEALQKLLMDIQEYVRNFAPLVKIPELNKQYIVKYTHNKSLPTWYRARLVNISTDVEKQAVYTVYTVLFVDYGNKSHLTSLASIREISGQLAQPAPFAQQCKLFDLYPTTSTWDPKAQLHMAQIITGGFNARNTRDQFEDGSTSTEVVMVTMNKSDGIWEVDLLSITSSETASVRDALIFVGLAIPHCSSADSQASSTSKSVKSVSKLHMRTQNFQNGEEFIVFVSNVINPHEIYIQVADYMEHVDHLNNVMTNNYNRKAGQGKPFGSVRGDSIYVPRKNMVVAVHLNGLWYRGTVTKVIKGEGTVTVFLVDYGTEVTISYTQIRRLPDRYRKLECQALKVQLAYVKPTSESKNWDTRAAQFFYNFITNKTRLRLVIVSNEKVPLVAIFESSGRMESCINNALVNEGLAEPTQEASQLLKYYLDYNNKTPKEETFVCDLLNTIQCSTHVNESSDSEEENVIRKPVRILLCKSPDEIFVELIDPEEQQMHKILHAKLQAHYSKQKKELRKWQINEPCVAYNTKVNQFFRAIVIEEVGKLYKVFLKDVAEEITVPADTLFVLYKEFKQYRDKSVRVHLASVIPAGDRSKWSGLANELLQCKFEQHDKVLMTKNGPIDHNRKSVPVIMWYSEIKPGGALEPSKTVLININKLLIKNGLALKPKIEDVEKDHDKTLNDVPVKEEISDSPSLQAIPTKINIKELSAEILKKLNSQPSIQENSGTNVHALKSENYLKENSDQKFVQPAFIENNEQFFTPIGVSKEFEHFPFRPRSAELSANNLQCFDKRLSVSSSNSPSHVVEKRKTAKHNQVVDWNDLIEQEAAVTKDEVVVHIGIEKECSDWLPPIPFKSKSFYAIATFVDDNSCIYIHEDYLEPILKEMEVAMKNHFNKTSSEPVGTVWVPGQLCTVKYFVNDSWYRGKITSVTEDFVKVFLIDYGNEEECKHDDLRFRVMYLDLPAFATKVQLCQVYPKVGTKWLTSDLDELHKKVVENKIHVTIKKTVKPDVPAPAIIKLAKVNINQYMREFSSNLVALPASDSSSDDTRDGDSDDVIIESEQSDAQLSSSSDEEVDVKSYCSKPLPERLIGQNIPVTVTSIINFNELILEILFDCSVQETRKLFEIISQDIRDKGENQPELLDLQKGQACIAKFSEDGQWYRGEVRNLDHVDTDLVYVWFVDFGNSEYVHKQSVRSVQSDWLRLPILQYRVRIDDVELGDPSYLDLVVECMSAYCNTTKVAEIVSVDPLIVKLYNNDNALAYQDLIDQNLLRKID